MKKYKRREMPYEFFITVEYIPFPSEEARRKAYETHAKLFLIAKERELREKLEREGQGQARVESGKEVV